MRTGTPLSVGGCRSVVAELDPVLSDLALYGGHFTGNLMALKNGSNLSPYLTLGLDR